MTETVRGLLSKAAESIGAANVKSKYHHIKDSGRG
jgi:hypothetical protein